MRVLLLGLFLAWPLTLLAETPEAPDDALAWLQKIAAAAHELNYSGTFIYQYGNHTETSRIVHAVDSSGEHEKLEILDGLPREIIRNNDEVQCFLPESKTVKVEKRLQRKPFPALLPEQLNNLSESYLIKLGGHERIAGFHCQALLLEPKDDLRYGYHLWAETNSGLLLKASMLDEKNDVVEQMTFTQLNIGGPIDEEALKPKYPAKAAGWRYDRSGQPEQISTETGWSVKNPLAGFKKIMEAKRMVSGKPAPISHIVYSDGLAAVSVFIEPRAPGVKPLNGVSKRGALNIYTKPLDDYQVTVLGEAPPMTVMQIGNSVYYTGK
ncbi:MAG TPA: MucB/RseB C-terminal domain-containing protein [Burkholderiales bacterium]